MPFRVCFFAEKWQQFVMHNNTKLFCGTLANRSHLRGLSWYFRGIFNPINILCTIGYIEVIRRRFRARCGWIKNWDSFETSLKNFSEVDVFVYLFRCLSSVSCVECPFPHSLDHFQSGVLQKMNQFQ